MTIAIVTGGSRGLGRNAVEHLAPRGVDIILTYRSKEAEANEAVKAVEAQGRRAAALKLDVARTDTFDAFIQSVREVLSDWGAQRFDYLFNNAGIGVHALFAETTE